MHVLLWLSAVMLRKVLPSCHFHSMFSLSLPTYLFVPVAHFRIPRPPGLFYLHRCLLSNFPCNDDIGQATLRPESLRESRLAGVSEVGQRILLAG